MATPPAETRRPQTYPQATPPPPRSGHHALMHAPRRTKAPIPALRTLAAASGLILLDDALAAGWSRSAVYRCVTREKWVRLERGAWVPPEGEVDPGIRVRAAQRTVPALVASHRTAAHLWGIELLDGVGPLMTYTDLRGQSAPCRAASAAGRIVHRCALAAEDVTYSRSGLRLTTPTRTLADLVRTETCDVAVVALDSALTWRGKGAARRGPLCSRDQVQGALRSMAFKERSARLRWVALADPLCDSPAETVARLRMYEAGLRPESQAELRTARGRWLRVDFLFRARGVVVEIEGYAYHGSRAAHERDVARFNALQSCPEVRTVLRFTALEVFRAPHEVIARIRAALAGDA